MGAPRGTRISTRFTDSERRGIWEYNECPYCRSIPVTKRSVFRQMSPSKKLEGTEYRCPVCGAENTYFGPVRQEC